MIGIASVVPRRTRSGPPNEYHPAFVNPFWRSYSTPDDPFWQSPLWNDPVVGPQLVALNHPNPAPAPAHGQNGPTIHNVD